MKCNLLNTFVLALSIVLASLGTTHAAEQPPTLPLGASAPDFNLPGVDGRNYALKDSGAAKILVIVFTDNHCATGQFTAYTCSTENLLPQCGQSVQHTTVY